MEALENILIRFKDNLITPEEAHRLIESSYYSDIGHTVVDTGRKERTGYPEAIFCQGKTPGQISEIIRTMKGKGIDVIATRMDFSVSETVCADFPGGTYHRDARVFTLPSGCREKRGSGFIAVLCAGTSDLPVAEEAAVTAEFYGHEVKRFYDVGIAGIHRLFRSMEEIRSARVIIAAAGMEGSLPGVVAGLVKAPVVAVPVSVGYGAGVGGISALLSMLTSCASGISVVNIDNGFGAAQFASRICCMT